MTTPLSSQFFWSSVTAAADTAQGVDFGNGDTAGVDRWYQGRVRAVLAF